jgi:hypothetical protein
MATSGVFFVRDTRLDDFLPARAIEPSSNIPHTPRLQSRVPKRVSQGEMTVAIFVGLKRQILALRRDKSQCLKKDALSS